MANTLGALVVRLGLDAADFVTGMTRSEQEAQRFSRRLERNLTDGAKSAGVALGAVVAAAGAAAVAIDQLIKKAAGFQDLAEETNASAEAIASFAVSAAVAGVEVGSIAGAMNKLTKNLVGVDDESKAAGAALKALGLNVAEFKKLDPAAQYEAVGKALAEFEDGAEKTAVAMALFGKSGAEQLKVFKALQEAGGRQIILTAEQIRQADEYADKQAKATAELSLYAQAMAIKALPVVTAFTGALSDTARELLGIDASGKKLRDSNDVEQFAEKTVRAITFVIDAAESAVRVIQGIGIGLATAAAVAAQVAQGNFSGAVEAANAAREDLEKLINSPLLGRQIQAAFDARRALSGSLDPDAAREADRFARQAAAGRGTRRLNFSGAVSGGSTAAAKISEAERYLDNLQKQLDKTAELSVFEQALLDIQRGRLGALSPLQEQNILNLAKEIDATKEAARVADERAQARKKDAEAGLAELKRLEDADRSRLQRLLDTGPAAQLEKQRQEVMFLTRAFEEGRISVEQYLDAATGFLGLNKTLENTKTIAEELGLTFASAFEDAIVSGKGLSEILRGLEQDILRIVTRKMVTEPLANWFGEVLKPSGGGNFLDSIGGFFSSIFGGGRAIGGPVESGRMYRVNESAPELLQVNGQQFLMMGNQRGRVTPLAEGGGGGSIVVNVQMPSGATRQTGQQFGAEIARQLSRAQNRNG